MPESQIDEPLPLFATRHTNALIVCVCLLLLVWTCRFGAEAWAIYQNTTIQMVVSAKNIELAEKNSSDAIAKLRAEHAQMAQYIQAQQAQAKE